MTFRLVDRSFTLDKLTTTSPCPSPVAHQPFLDWIRSLLRYLSTVFVYVKRSFTLDSSPPLFVRSLAPVAHQPFLDWIFVTVDRPFLLKLGFSHFSQI